MRKKNYNQGLFPGDFNHLRSLNSTIEAFIYHQNAPKSLVAAASPPTSLGAGQGAKPRGSLQRHPRLAIAGRDRKSVDVAGRQNEGWGGAGADNGEKGPIYRQLISGCAATGLAIIMSPLRRHIFVCFLAKWGFFGPSSVKRGRTHIVLG